MRLLLLKGEGRNFLAIVAVAAAVTAGRALPKFAKPPTLGIMSTMNISLPETLKDFVDQQVAERGYGTSSEYVRELIRRDRDRLRLRGLLLAGAESASSSQADAAYFEGLRARVRTDAATRR
jgi:antitoxin ParD1/3/4